MDKRNKKLNINNKPKVVSDIIFTDSIENKERVNNMKDFSLTNLKIKK